jgi:hypothetical protein
MARLKPLTGRLVFKNTADYLHYTDKITDAFYDGDVEKMSQLLGHKVTNIEDGENYFNDVWKSKTKILKPNKKVTNLKQAKRMAKQLKSKKAQKASLKGIAYFEKTGYIPIWEGRKIKKKVKQYA